MLAELRCSMGRNDWQRLGNEENFVAVSAPPKKTGVLPILGVLVALGSLGVLVSYYLPLYRAHEALNGEYVKLAIHGREQQEQLEQTVTALKRTAADRDQLKAAQGSARVDTEAARANLGALNKALTTELSAQTGKKLIALSATEAAIEIQFLSPTLFRSDASAPTALGKDLLCRIARASGNAAVKYSVVGAASVSDTKQRALKAFPTPWHLSAARGASAAQLLAEACKVAPSAILAAGSPSTDTQAALLTLKLSL